MQNHCLMIRRMCALIILNFQVKCVEDLLGILEGYA